MKETIAKINEVMAVLQAELAKAAPDFVTFLRSK